MRDESVGLGAVLGAALRSSSPGLLVPIRDWLGASNVALVLAIVVVGAAIVGGRLAGAVPRSPPPWPSTSSTPGPTTRCASTSARTSSPRCCCWCSASSSASSAVLRAGSRREADCTRGGRERLEDVAAVVAAGATLDEAGRWSARP